MARQRGRFPARSHRLTDWSFGPDNQPATTLSATGSALGANGALVAIGRATLVRFRGFLSLIQSAGTALDGFTGAVGIGVTTSEAFAVGTSAVRLPETDADWDGWLWHTFFDTRVPGATAGGEGFVVRMQMDSKAMRKLTQDDVVFGAIEVGEVGTGVLSWQFNSRMLLKLS